MMAGTDPVSNPGPAAAPAPARLGGWTRAILIGSLVLNLLLLGAIVGAGVSHRMAPERMPPGDGSLGFLTEALPEADRRALRRAMIDRMPDPAALRRDMVRDTHALLDALRADPYDRGAVETALAAQRARVATMLQSGLGTLLDRLDEMGQADRRAFADRLEQAIRHRRPDHD